MKRVTQALLLTLAGLPALEASDLVDKDSPFYYAPAPCCSTAPSSFSLPLPGTVLQRPYTAPFPPSLSANATFQKSLP
ncbi:uncharacterized protein [Callorhinus ursinus]|uniref:uncharacterized protein isoform X3 n=1 Tax=Callorhinus ursinus TaxID=34884 RepID=UPI003CD0156C